MQYWTAVIFNYHYHHYEKSQKFFLGLHNCSHSMLSLVSDIPFNFVNGAWLYVKLEIWG